MKIKINIKSKNKNLPCLFTYKNVPCLYVNRNKNKNKNIFKKCALPLCILLDPDSQLHKMKWGWMSDNFSTHCCL
jgi:hypothetical protein